MARRPALVPFVSYILAFHFAWIAWPYIVYPWLQATLGPESLAYAAMNIAIRLAVWVLPVLLYLRYVDRVEPFAYLKLRQHVRRGVITALALTALNVIGTAARVGPPHLSMDRVTWNSVIGTSFFVGFIEEVPYRGFILQKFCERVNFWTANAITSVLFVAIHVPGWMALHLLRGETAASVFIFSLVMGAAFRYTGSLWAPIITHSANDFMSFVLFRL